MMKIFRNLPRRQAGIRKNLLYQEKTTSYFKHAIDEFVLVVIIQKYNQNLETLTYHTLPMAIGMGGVRGG